MSLSVRQFDICHSPQVSFSLVMSSPRGFRHGGWVNTIPKFTEAGCQLLARKKIAQQLGNPWQNNLSNTYNFIFLCETYLFSCYNLEKISAEL